MKWIAIALAIGLTVGSGSGWYAKGVKVKADKLDELEDDYSSLQTLAQDSLNGLQSSWEQSAKENYDRLARAGFIRAEDDAHEAEVLVQMRKNNRDLQKIMEGFSMAGDLGGCQLTSEFVGLWGQAIETIRADGSKTSRDSAATGDHEP